MQVITPRRQARMLQFPRPADEERVYTAATLALKNDKIAQLLETLHGVTDVSYT